MNQEIATFDNALPVPRSKIDAFEDAVNALPKDRQRGPEAFPLKHYVTDNGLYAREIILPAGTVVVGKVKKEEYISVIADGVVTEVTEAGLQRIKAPYTMVCKPCTKRIVWTHETAVWVTIHSVPPGEDDLDKLYDFVTASSYEEAERFVENLT